MKNNSLVSEGHRLYEEIETQKFVAEVEEHVSYGDLHSLFPNYKVEHYHMENRIKKAWFVAYTVGILLMILVGTIVFIGSPSPEVAIWVAFGFMVILTYGFRKRYYRNHDEMTVSAQKISAVVLALSSLLMMALGFVGVILLGAQAFKLLML